MNNTESLVAAHVAWAETINAGHQSQGLATMSDDAVIVSPDGSTAVGRTQVTELIAALTSAPGFHLDFELDTVSVSDDGLAGVVVGKSGLTFTSPDGTLVTTEQTLLTVWRKDNDQTWRCYVDAVMPSIAPPPLG
mgnify:CR=1 FL=1